VGRGFRGPRGPVIVGGGTGGGGHGEKTGILCSHRRRDQGVCAAGRGCGGPPRLVSQHASPLGTCQLRFCPSLCFRTGSSPSRMRMCGWGWPTAARSSRRRGTMCTQASGWWRPPPWPFVGGHAHGLSWLLRGDSRATFCGDSAESRPTAWNGRSAIWRHNKFLGAGPVHDQDDENDVHAAKSHAKCALKDNLLTSVETATLRSYSDDITVSKKA